jgi:PncC family amidohydrolase
MKKEQIETAEQRPESISQLSAELESQVVSIIPVLRDKKLTLGFAESCTGGLLSSAVTAQVGVSDVFIGSIISYDNRIKQQYLNVSEEVLQAHGAVSAQVAVQMAEQLCLSMQTSLAVSITGIAGPGGGTADKPVGTVFIAVAGLQSAGQRPTALCKYSFAGNRRQVQLQSCLAALKQLRDFMK